MKTEAGSLGSMRAAPEAPLEEPGTSRRRSIVAAVWLLGVFGVWRLVLHAVGHFAKASLQPNPLLAQWQATKRGLGIWNQWDANYYLSIAARGYDRPDWPAFFPLYPLLVRAVRLVFFNAISLDAAALLTNIFLAGASVVLLYLLGRRLFDDATGKRAAFYMLAFPTAVFLGVAYSESLYLTTTIAAFYAAERKQWWLAGVMGALASATRLTGVLVLPALVIAYLHAKRWRLRDLGLAWLWLGSIPLGVIGYFAFLEASGKGWWGYFEALEIGWPGRSLSWNLLSTPFVDVLPLFRGDKGDVWGGFVALIDFVAIVGATAGLFVIWRKLPKHYFVYSALILSAVLASSIPVGASRYVLGMFPLFLVLGEAGRKVTVDRFYILIAIPLLGIFTAMYATGYWIG